MNREEKDTAFRELWPKGTRVTFKGKAFLVDHAGVCDPFSNTYMWLRSVKGEELQLVTNIAAVKKKRTP